MLQLRWQGTDDVDAFDGKKLAHLLEADLGLSPRHHAADGLALDLPDAFPQRLGDTEPLQQGLDVDAAGTRRMGKRLRSHQRARERIGRAEVGPRRTRPHRNADAGSRKVDAAAGHDPARTDQLVEPFSRHDDEVHGVAPFETIGDGRRRPRHRAAPSGAEIVPAGALEPRRQHLEGRLERAGAEHIDFSSRGFRHKAL